ncbi:MAG: DASS family sodium-coupled anion symporter [Candidatus Bathyarchaeota archaeon]|nr:DASS family sodium-coupled anion symporter [Candidatus Bathyarchaeota archaeon]MDW8040833.1 DASS family sodium-coupled anion symporter [Nitrososphaerota archaeon]
MDFRKTAKLVTVVASVLAAYCFTAPLEEPMRLTFALLIFAAGLWVTELLPMGITAFIIAVAQPILGIQTFEKALAPFFSPTVVLILGSFFLALAFEKQDLDEALAYRIVMHLGSDAKKLVLGLMFTTAFLSMWLSNTATAALMMTLALSLTIKYDREKDKENFSKAMVLGIAYSASVGGIATLIGTPPNMVAAGMLRELAGYNLTFLEWILYGLPITVILVLLIWVILFKLFPVGEVSVQKPKKEVAALNAKQKFTLAVFILAAFLWITSSLPDPLAALLGWSGHGLSAGLVALSAAVILFFMGVLNQHDIPKVDWNTVLLFGGGLSLGAAMDASGLTDRIGQSLAATIGGGSLLVLFTVLGFSALLFTMVASNTASANVFVPIAISVSLAAETSPVISAVLVAICCSLDFMLPVGTPPNAIAYSTGKVKVKEMAKAGLLLDIMGALITILLAVTFWPFIS